MARLIDNIESKKSTVKNGLSKNKNEKRLESEISEDITPIRKAQVGMAHVKEKIGTGIPNPKTPQECKLWDSVLKNNTELGEGLEEFALPKFLVDYCMYKNDSRKYESDDQDICLGEYCSKPARVVCTDCYLLCGRQMQYCTIICLKLDWSEHRLSHRVARAEESEKEIKYRHSKLRKGVKHFKKYIAKD